MSNTGIGGAANWIAGMMLGPLATIMATLAVAIFGFLLLQGRLDWRQSARTILGCFLIFGAPVVATALLMPAVNGVPAMSDRAAEPVIAPPPPPAPEPYDPYAGAALPSGW